MFRQRIKEDYRALQIERDDADRALIRARALAREMKEKAILIQAREQGRQEGFEEGLRQGRRLPASNEEEESSGGEASGSGNAGGGGQRTRRRTTNKGSSRRNGHRRSNTNPDGPSQASLEAEATRAIAERESLRVQLQLKDVERELDMERSRMKEMMREREKLDRIAREEMERRAEREKERERHAEREREKERGRAREKEAREAREREARDAREREKEREMREVVEKERKERVRLEKEKEEMEQQKKDVEQKLAEAEERRLKEKAKFEKQLRKEKEKLPYLAMAPPPDAKTSSVPRVPRTSSSGSHRNPPTRRFSTDSSQASTIPFDMLQLPTERERERAGDDLSVIYEDSSVRGGSTTPSVTSAAVPTWVTHPPVDYGRVTVCCSVVFNKCAYI